jgi:diketogulonate reductase-like aldo/keto reductase
MTELQPPPLVDRNGAQIPSFGLGTWQLRGEPARAMVRTALALGVRHIDTASRYENGRDVGEEIRSSGIVRDEIFVTSKIWHDQLDADSVMRNAETMLADLDIGYIDLLLIHWPNKDVPLKETLGAFAALKRRGIIRHIGVSNFTSTLIEEAVAVCDEPIVTNQVEYHPYLAQSKVLEACRRHEISLTAYSPLAQGRIVGDKVIADIARTHGRRVAQVSLRWLVQQEGIIVIPRSSKREHLANNFAIYDFALTAAEMRHIASLSHPQGRQVNPAWAPAWD